MYFAAIHTSPRRGRGDTSKKLRRRAHVSRRALRRWLRGLAYDPKRALNSAAPMSQRSRTTVSASSHPTSHVA